MTPAFLTVLSFLLFRANSHFWPFPLLLIPLFEPKLSLLPLIIVVLNSIWTKKILFLPLITSLLILFLTWRSFWGQTIFTYDYQAHQAVIGKSYLYPSVFTARLFQNKARIYGDRLANNFLALTDPNNYFFGFHPREIVLDNQNLKKYPFLGIVFMLFGIYYLHKNPDKGFILSVLLGSILSLSILKLFDRNDFVLWFPLSLLYTHGVNIFLERQALWKTAFSIVFITFSIPQLLRIFLQ